jgi:hypothetical protein
VLVISFKYQTMSSKSKKVLLPHPEKGALGQYSTSSAEKTRHAELNKSVRAHGYKSTILDLNLRATLNKNRSPKSSEIMHKDMDYLRSKYRGGSRKSKKSRKHRSKASKKSRKSRQHKSASRKSRKSKK